MRVRTHVNPLNFHERMSFTPYDELFSEFKGVLDIEIGFGRGVFLKSYADLHKDRNIMGVEVRSPMVTLLKTALGDDYNHVHLVHGSAEICFNDMIVDNSVNRVFLFHPDPWFKKKHNKRRVLSVDFLNLLYRKLAVGGCLYISTDVEILWDEMNLLLTRHSGFTSFSDPLFWDSFYKTHWDTFSKKDERLSYFGGFKKVAGYD